MGWHQHTSSSTPEHQNASTSTPEHQNASTSTAPYLRGVDEAELKERADEDTVGTWNMK